MVSTLEKYAGKKARSTIRAIIICIMLVAIIACTRTPQEQAIPVFEQVPMQQPAPPAAPETPPAQIETLESPEQATPLEAPETKPTQAWQEVVLTDVITGDTFRLRDFRGTPVIVETMAVWCPLCAQQQRQIQKLVDEIGEKIKVVSIDTDPNEDERTLRGHVQGKGYNWPFVIDPGAAVGRALVAEFGSGVVSAPNTPVIIIDKEGNARLLRYGIKSSEELKAELD